MINRLHAQFPHFEADEISWDVQPESVDFTSLADQLAVIRHLNKKECLLVAELGY